MAVDVEALYTRYGPMVLRRCRYLLRDEADALDAMQDTFVQVLRHRERLDARGPSSLLYCIATNVCLNRLRTLRRGPMSGDDRILAGIASTEDVESRAVAAGFLDRVFASERASTRTMAVLHYVDGMTLEEVARHVRLSVSGVRKRLAGLSERARALEEA